MPPSIFRLRSRGSPSSGASSPKQIIITRAVVTAGRRHGRGRGVGGALDNHHPQFSPISPLNTLCARAAADGQPDGPWPTNMQMAQPVIQSVSRSVSRSGQSQRCEFVLGEAVFLLRLAAAVQRRLHSGARPTHSHLISRTDCALACSRRPFKLPSSARGITNGPPRLKCSFVREARSPFLTRTGAGGRSRTGRQLAEALLSQFAKITAASDNSSAEMTCE